MVDFVPFPGMASTDNNTQYPANQVMVTGNSGTVTASGSMVVLASTTGFVGIGTASPAVGLDVNTSAIFRQSFSIVGTLSANALISNVYGLFGQNITVNSSNASTSTSTGAIVTLGGIGLAGNIYAGGNIVLAGSGKQFWGPPSDSTTNPGYAWNSDVGTGMSRPSTSVIAFSGGAVERMRITANGNLQIGSSTQTSITTAATVINSLNGGGTQWVNNNNGGGNISALSTGGLAISTFTGAIGSETITERLRIDLNGNLIARGTVGVGTNSATGFRTTANSSNLYVWGNVIIANTALTSSGIYFPNGSYLTTGSYGPTNTIQVAGSGNAILGDSGNFVWDLTNRRLGIGTSTPANQINVYGTDYVLFNTRPGAGVRQEITVGNVISFGAVLGYDPSIAQSIGYLRRGDSAASTPAIAWSLVSSNYRVGINAVTQPQNALDINGAVAIGTNFSGLAAMTNTNGLSVQGTVGIGTFTPSTSSSVLTLFSAAGAGIQLASGGAAGGGNIRGSTSGGLVFSNYTGGVGAETFTETMRVDSLGNVSMGTSTVLFAQGGRISLSVNGPTQGLIAIGNAGTGQAAWYTDGSLVYMYANALPWAIYAAGAQPIISYTNGTERMRILSGPTTIGAGGNVLIGTNTTPLTSTATEVINSINGGGTEWVNNNNGGGNISALSTGGLAISTFTGAVGAEVVTERMRVTSAGKILVGTIASPSGVATNLFLTSTTGAGVQFGNKAISGSNIGVGFGNSIVFSSYTGTVAGSETYTQRAQISGLTGNLLVGTATLPAGSLAAAVINSVPGGGIELVNNNSGGANIGTPAAATLTISTFTGAVGAEVYTERARITPNGNLFIGTATTPLSGNATVVIQSVGTNGGGIELSGGAAGGLREEALNGGGAAWSTYTGAVGAEVYTERLRLVSNGKLLLGATIPPVGVATNLFVNATTGGGIQFGNNTVSGSNIGVGFGNSVVFSSYTGTVAGAETYTQRAQISGLTGNLLVGTATLPAGSLATQVINSVPGGGIELVNNNSGGANIGVPTAATMTISTFTGAVGAEVYTERARITANGNLLVGSATTPAGTSATLVINGVGTNPGGITIFNQNNGGGNIQALSAGGLQIGTFTGAAGAEVYNALVTLTKPGTNATGNLLMAGNINATLEVYAYFSDIRLKDNVVPITNALDRVSAINGVFYNPNEMAERLLGESRTTNKVGVIAQEVEAVLPHVIKQAPFDTAPDGTSISGQNYKTVQYEKLVPLLIEAIKEQQVQIRDLEARVTFLELDP